jgi:hypothetical protein
MDGTITEREDLWRASYNHFVNTTQKTLEKAFLGWRRNDFGNGREREPESGVPDACAWTVRDPGVRQPKITVREIE